MSGFLTLDDIDLNGKRVLVRVDINVPIKDGRVTDDTRIRTIVPTVCEIIAKGGMPILVAHMGRPKGQYDASQSLAPLAEPLANALGSPVVFAGANPEWTDAQLARSLQPGQALLLENIRFHAGEEKNDPALCQALAALGDIYVNDAFSVAHRAHASTAGIARLLPAVAGRLMQAELEALEKALAQPVRPVIAVVGGAKISTKLDLLGNLIAKVDQLIIGGGMANTFLAAQGIGVGRSLCEHDLLDTARRIMAEAEQTGCAIVLPTDIVVAREFKAGAANETVGADACPADAMILDAGPASVADFGRRFALARTIVWNGPLGAFEIPPFDAATNASARTAAMLAKSGRTLVVAGGGDTVAALNAAGVAQDFSYVSTAGGAFLEWLEGKNLPGVAALTNRTLEDA
ncbi:MAG: phosphoglycerate kinase [Hyphomicrobiaceae bacterium]|nr:phosphoglycerate kinase [Hyphomicrobiaceae bacterium]